MKTILIIVIALLFGAKIVANNDSLNLNDLKFDIHEEDIYQDLYF